MADDDEDDTFESPYERPPSLTSRPGNQRRRTSVFSNLNSSNGLTSAALSSSIGRRGSVAPGMSGGRRASRAGLVFTPPDLSGPRNAAKARAKAFWEILRQHVVRFLSRPAPISNAFCAHYDFFLIQANFSMA